MTRTPRRRRDRPTLPELLFAQFNEHRSELLEWQPVALRGDDPEGVHKMRVATRRLRMLLRTFSGLFDPATEAQLGTELRWLAGILGRARDADVCEIEVTRICSRLPDATGIAPYCAYLRAADVGAYAALDTALSSDRYASLIAGLHTLTESNADAGTVKRWRKRSFSRQAEERVAISARRVKRRGRRIGAESSLGDYHRLRIAAKQQRYLLDCLSIVQPRKWRRLIAVLTQLQDLLGEHQDAATASERHQTYAATVPMTADHRSLLLTLGRLLQIEADRLEHCHAAFPAVWTKYTRVLKALSLP